MEERARGRRVMTEDRTSPARLRKVYRSPAQNAFFALAFAVLMLPGTWWSVAYFLLVGGVGIVRSLRRCVIVTDESLIERRVLKTQAVPWRQLRELSISHRNSRRQVFTTTVSDRDFRVVVHNAKKGVPFSDAVDEALARMRHGSSQVWPPSRAYGRTRVALWICLFGGAFGAVWLQGFLWQRDRYEARAARELTAIATVARSRIVEHDDGEDGTTYSTRAAVVFEAADRHVATTIERPGQHRFRAELELPIVYDSAHPEDADFGDRPNREDEESGARAGVWAGAIMSAIGIIGGVVLGTLMFSTWLRYRSRTSVVDG
jgi:hypothetical protein